MVELGRSRLFKEREFTKEEKVEMNLHLLEDARTAHINCSLESLGYEYMKNCVKQLSISDSEDEDELDELRIEWE